ncbi:MAG: ABC transporter, partial [Pirellulaceae bacterium]
IGLDVIAQHQIQQFLRHYQAERKITIMLTSHYMKDVAALCQRVVVIAQGRVQYDGSLEGIIDNFSSEKIVTLQLSEGQDSQGLEKYGRVQAAEWPRVKLRVTRQNVPSVLASLLSRYTVEDVAVEDPPLEEVIANLFAKVSATPS